MRTDFYLYIDEFQNYATPSLASILSGTRKYGLGCILAHQDMIQLQKQDNELASSVISNAGTRVCFRLGDIDAKRFEDGFASFEARDLQNLGVGEAIARIERPEYDFNISVLRLHEIEPAKGEAAKNLAISLSRKTYGVPKEEVEKTLEYLRNVQTTHEEPKTTEPVIQKQEISKSQKEQTVVEVPNLDENQKAKAKEGIVKRKELTGHRYLQTFFKTMAEERGYKAVIEEPTPDGKGFIDVSLERNGKKIAVEIRVTTSIDWELHNIEKRLNAGYEMVVAIVNSPQAAKEMQNQIRQKFDAVIQKKIMVFQRDEFIAYLDKQMAEEAATETRIKGYRVKTEYNAVSKEEMNRKNESLAKIVLDSLRKGKDK